MNWQKIKEWLLKMNSEGVPLPMLKDPKTGKGSVTLTMMWISFNVSILALAGKITNLLGGVDYSDTLWLLGLTSSLYLGRKIQKNGKDFTIEPEDKQ
jgi:hypothetical protein